MIGTLLNTAAVVVGATAGTLLGGRLPERGRSIALQGLGLVTLVFGGQMALQVQSVLVLLTSILVGGLLGELLNIEARMERLGAWAEAHLEPIGDSATEARGARFARGFVTSSLIFCVGPVAILGAIQDGISGDYRLLAIKSLLDGIGAVVFSSTLGKGVFLSAAVVLIYQGTLTLVAQAASGFFVEPASNPAVLEMTAVGGTLVLGIGLKLLNVAAIRVGNFLPALFLAPLFTTAIRAFGTPGG